MSQNVIIVGAPRSGTNMLRDVLTSARGITTWPCDEVNLLWKHGNLDIASDEIPADRATPAVRRYLRKQFAAIGAKASADVVVEKTCATSLRVPFAAACFPDAKYVFIHRDGIDATASTMQRWNAAFDLGYTLRKVRYVPPSDLPRHLAAFAGKKVRQLRSGDAGSTANDLLVSTWWGPRPHDYADLQRHHPLEELAFIQWQRCVEQSADALAHLPGDQVLTVRYEDYVSDPHTGTGRILDFLGVGDRLASAAVGKVMTSSVGKGRAQLGPEAVSRLVGLGGSTLERFGYDA